MRWTRLALAVALVAAAAPAAGGAPRSADTRAQRHAEWLRERERLGRGHPLVADHTRLEDLGDYAELAAAGDLDGDGAGDLLDVRSHARYDEVAGFVETVRLEAHRGRDGAALWTVALPPASLVIPVPAPVGVDGKRGVLVITYTDVSASTPAAYGTAYDTSIAAYSGAGLLLWRRSLPGTWGDSLPGFAAADVQHAGLFDAVAGGGTDVLLQGLLVPSPADPAGAAPAQTAYAQLAVLDGATGAVTPLGRPFASEWDIPYAYVAGDLDRDGRDDAVVDIGKPAGADLLAVSTADGETLWTRAKYTPRGGPRYLEPVADVTGDGVEDVVAKTYTFADGPGDSFELRQTVTLVDGATGAPRWRKPGSGLVAIGNVDRRPGAELILGGPAPAGYAGFTVAAYDAAGRTVWSTTRKVRRAERAPWSSSWSAFTDFNADGVLDVGYGVVAGYGKSAKRDEGWVDGRTGRVRRDPRPGMYGTRAALDGRGGDAYQRTVAGGVATIEAWRGDAPARLWTVGVRVGAGAEFAHVLAASVDGDRCDDLALGTYTDETFTDVLLSGGTGKPLWTLTRTGEDAAVVGKPAVTKHQVFRRSC